MRLKIISLVEPAAVRLLPAGLAARLLAIVDRVDAMIEGRDDSAVSQRTVVFAFAIRVLSAAIAYLSQVAMARWMGDFQYGIFVAVWVAVVILGGIACLGFQTGVIRFISEYRAMGEEDGLRGVLRAALAWAFAGATVMALVGVVVVYFISDQISNYYVMPIYLITICLPMLALQEVQDGIARAHNWPGAALAPTFILRPLLILAAMAIATWAGFAADAPTAVLSAVAATWVASLIQFAVLSRRLAGTVPKGPRSYFPRQWLAITIPIFLVEGFYNLLTNTDILFVGYYLPPDQVGVYFAAAKTLALVHFVYFAVKAGSAHRFATYFKSGNRERYEQFIQETIHWTFWPSLALAVIMGLLGKYFLVLFGPSFVNGAELLWILAAGVVVRSSVGAAESVLTMSGEQRTCALVYAASLSVNVCLNMTLIPRLGLEGAAIATSAALAFEAAALYAAAKRRLGLHIFILPARTHITPRGATR